MSPTWYSDTSPDPDPPLRARDWLWICLRGLPLGVLVFGGLAVHLLVRLVERPLFGAHRPVTPGITRFVCRNALRILGLGFALHGNVKMDAQAFVANHSSWLDIFVLNACTRLYFVSKAEVSRWPGIGWLARATGTVFITRDRREAQAQSELFQSRLAAGHKLLFFPEGTSTDGRRVLSFKSTLFAAFFTQGAAPDMSIQPISVIYHAPETRADTFYGWWGDMDFGPHLLRVLAARPQGRVDVVAHPPLSVADCSDRKILAQRLGQAVRQGVEDHIS